MKLLTHSGILHNRKWIAQVVYLEVDIGQTIALLESGQFNSTSGEKRRFLRWRSLARTMLRFV